MRKFFSLLLTGILFLSVACNSGQKKAESATDEKSATEEIAADNALTTAEKEAGWILLFDGESTEGWRGVNKAVMPGAWEVIEGTLHCQGSGKGEAGATDGGDILFDKKFKNFNLKLEWKISEGGNSGIFYLGQEVPEWPIWKTAPEMQVLDNERHPDSFLGKDGNRQAGSLYDLIPAKPQNTKPAGEWNSVEIICYKGTVIHKQNGETVVEYHLWTDDWNTLVADSKFPGLNENWANVAEEGFIALQDHGDDVWFKNIKIREL
ncbi:3-keto-disaccharide hydrolase [Gaoshiqia sp. Z1-71]|uniref:3-keto-disaccharide hydrolase n=1 Tax=Gaoshiqia hydrogeniformans TaxID=3290090 RepID=UPI003BF91836